jgi:L-lactate dehydrogenase complex protein LldE
VPLAQSCCGQPGYNAGAIDAAAPIARRTIASFEPFDYLVTPSGSCAGMIAHHYPKLLAGDPAWRQRALALSAKTHEITGFLVDVLDWQPRTASAREGRRFTYHDSCAGLREMGIKTQPRKLLAGAGVTVDEMQGTEVCCGFGGSFCAKLPDISLAMADEKLAHALASGANTLVGGDLGCLLHLGGRIAERGLALEVRHVTEVLDGALDKPALGAPPRR